MNMLPLAVRLETLRLGTRGVDLYVQMLPLEATDGILLRSPLTGTKINHELPGYFKTGFQVIVRGDSYEDTAARLDQIVAQLTFEGDTQVGPQLFKYCRPDTLPVAFPLSRANLVETSVQFDCCYIEE